MHSLDIQRLIKAPSPKHKFADKAHKRLPKTSGETYYQIIALLTDEPQTILDIQKKYVKDKSSIHVHLRTAVARGVASVEVKNGPNNRPTQYWRKR